MAVTGILTPDSWVPVLHHVSIFPDKYSAGENMKSPKFMPRACQVLAKSLVLGKNIMQICVLIPPGAHGGWKGQRPSLSSSLFWR